MNLKRWIARGRKVSAPVTTARPRAAAGHHGEDTTPLSVPGYGSPPVTRPLGGGPEPSNYGLPPRAPAPLPKRRHE